MYFRSLLTLKSAVLLVGTILFSACTSLSPSQFFEKVVLNTNIIADFGTEQFTSHLVAAAQYSDQNRDEEAREDDRARNEAKFIVNAKISYLEKALENVKHISADKDNEDIKNIVIELFEYTLPVYKNEYMDLAKLCDTQADSKQIEELTQQIAEKYNDRVELLFSGLRVKAKAYVEKHQINARID